MLASFLDVDSFKFGDIVRHWARERLVHEVLVGRELARGVVREGLRLNSVNPHWTDPATEFRGSPLVGFAARPGQLPVILRTVALEHLLAVDRQALDADPALLSDEVVARADFRLWLVKTGRSLPAFWFGADERPPPR